MFCIQGNIGSGKSTLLKNLARHGFSCAQEPVELWSDYKMDGKNIIEHFYADRKRFAFPFQMMAFYTRLKLFKKLPPASVDNPIIMERSVETDQRVFAQMQFDDGSIDPICERIYNEWYTELTEGTGAWNHPVNIYIRTSPEICYDRIAARGRSGEEVISLEYLQKCHDLHERWLTTTEYIIDGSQSADEVLEAAVAIIQSK
jgi:deoxyadenosine/deoxycytidine kinase